MLDLAAWSAAGSRDGASVGGARKGVTSGSAQSKKNSVIPVLRVLSRAEKLDSHRFRHREAGYRRVQKVES